MTKPLEEAKGCVLLVDDDPHVLWAHERLLLKAGYIVLSAASGAAALAKVEAGGIDVVVSDISMPGMSGVALLQMVRERDLDLPVILLTGEPSLATAAAAVNAGAQRYLEKPTSGDALTREGERAVQLYAWAKRRRSTTGATGEELLQAGDRAGLTASLTRAIAGMSMAYQPIVVWSKREILGYEAL